MHYYVIYTLLNGIILNHLLSLGQDVVPQQMVHGHFYLMHYHALVGASTEDTTQQDATSSSSHIIGCFGSTPS